MEVFVVLVHREHSDYQPSSEVYCVCSTIEKATEQMKKCFDEEYDYWINEYDYKEEEITKAKSSEYMSIYDGWGELTEITIEKEELI